MATALQFLTRRQAQVFPMPVRLTPIRLPTNIIRCNSDRSVVMAAAADSVSRSSRHRQYQTDNEEDDPDDQKKMGEGEGRDEAREDEPQDYKHNSENDHDGYLAFRSRFGRRIARFIV
jgi:hypothetical protein